MSTDPRIISARLDLVAEDLQGEGRHLAAQTVKDGADWIRDTQAGMEKVYSHLREFAAQNSPASALESPALSCDIVAPQAAPVADAVATSL